MKKKLLLADDSITIQKVVGIIFTPENYDLLIASDGDKAYEMVLEHQPDLVIADVVMPGKNGFELCREIKSNPALARTSVLLLPGAFEKFDEARAVEVCADGWLTKPFESQVLLDKVAALSEMPPLRLVAAEEPAGAVDTADMGGVAEPPDEPLMTDEEDSFFDQEQAVDQADDTRSATEIAVEDDSDGGLWDEVSFGEDDLKPHDLLAAGDQDEDEEITADHPEMDEAPVEPSEGLTAEQLAPYVSAVAQTDTQKEMDGPELASGTIEEEKEEEKTFGFIAGEAQEQDDFASAESEFDAATQTEEPSPAFEFSGEESGSAETQPDATDDVVELMEEDLDHEEELVEDSDTFIDLTDTDEELAEEDPAAESPFPEEVQASAEHEEILDLTEGDVVEDEPTVADTSFAGAREEDDEDGEVLVTEPDDAGDEIAEEVLADEAAVELTAPDQIPLEEREQLFTDPEDEVPGAQAEQIAEPAAGRRDDELFVDEDDDFLYSEDDDVDDFETAVAEPVAPSTSDATPVAADVEEQLRQLPEEELKNIIETVAGPMIEALAREMLEQTVWEVVPDLAETMISAEIEKIKRGEH